MTSDVWLQQDKALKKISHPKGQASCFADPHMKFWINPLTILKHEWLIQEIQCFSCDSCVFVGFLVASPGFSGYNLHPHTFHTHRRALLGAELLCYFQDWLILRI